MMLSNDQTDEIYITIGETEEIETSITDSDPIDISIDGSDTSGTRNYNELLNKPKINGVILQGDKASDDLHLQGKMQAMSVSEIEKILYLGG